MNVETTTIDVGCIRPSWLEERASIDIIVPPEARITDAITVLHPSGRLDGTGYIDLIDASQQAIDEGARRLLIRPESSFAAGPSPGQLAAISVPR